MKIKNGLFIVYILFACFSTANAQNIEKVKVLMFQFGLHEFPGVYSDSISISYQSNDTTWFHTTDNNPSGKGFYYKAGSKVYRENFSSGAILLYDYSLLKGDTFITKLGWQLPDSFIVDSVYFKKLNHRTFKAWHLTSVSKRDDNFIKLEWIEGLGELRGGWDCRYIAFVDAGWTIKGMCLNDSLIYWDSVGNYFKDRNPSPSCMFDSISKRLSVQKVVNNSINLYPNPASDVLHISSKTVGKASFTDVMGKTYLSDIQIQEGTQTIDISTLSAGAYVVVIRYGNEIIYKKILVLNNH